MSFAKMIFKLNALHQKSCVKLHQNMDLDYECKIIALVGLKQIWCVHLIAFEGNNT